MSFSVPPEHRAILEGLIDTGRLRQISVALMRTEDLDDPAEVAAQVSKDSGVSESQIREFLNVLVSMFLTRDSLVMEIEPFMKEVLNQLHPQLAIDDSVTKAFADMLSLSQLAKSSKSVELVSQHQRSYVRSEIISGLRVVFSEDDKPSSFVLAHELQIYFLNGSKQEMMSFGMDTEDLEMMAKTLGRAARRQQGLEKLAKGLGEHKND